MPENSQFFFKCKGLQVHFYTAPFARFNLWAGQSQIKVGGGF